MKKSLIVFLPIFLLCFSIYICATTNEYELEDLQLSLKIPSNYWVITRNTPNDDPAFEYLPITKSEIMKQLESENIYLSAISHKYEEELVVSMWDNSIVDFNLFSDTMIMGFVGSLVEKLENQGFTVTNYELYYHPQQKFVKLHYKDPLTSICSLQYCTVSDNKLMSFSLRSYSGEITSIQETIINNVVESILFNNKTNKEDNTEETKSFTYFDTKSKVMFEVPANWKKAELYKEREMIDVKFVSTKEEGPTIMYGSADLWETLSSSDREGYTRSQINNSIFTKSIIAEENGVPIEKVTTVTYNNITYYQIEKSEYIEMYEWEYKLDMIQLICIDNGWLYSFSFCGTPNSDYYDDFISLLKSVQCPRAINNKSSINKLVDQETSKSIMVVILGFIFICAIIVILLYKKENKKTSYMYCHNCGQKLPLDSEFCHICGVELIKQENNL